MRGAVRSLSSLSQKVQLSVIHDRYLRRNGMANTPAVRHGSPQLSVLMQ